jgi:hypothetical protein
MKNIDIYISLHGTPVSQMHNGKKKHLKSLKGMIYHLGDLSQKIIIFLHLKLLMPKHFQKPLIRTS